MGRRSVSRSDLLGVLARKLEQLGVQRGQELPRACFDDLIMVGCDVGPDSVNNYLSQGKAYGYWEVEAKHGKGGRGTVRFLGVPADDARLVAQLME